MGESFSLRLYWFHRRVLSKLFKLLYERNLDKISAMLMFIYTKFYTFVKLRGVAIPKDKKHRILAFNRETFEKDLMEMAKRTDIEIVFFPPFIYGAFFTAFLPLYMKDQNKYHLYNSPDELKLKGVFQNACNRVFPYLRKLLRFEAMISANIDYAQDQVWIEAGKQFGIPFVAVVKEGVQSDAHYEWWIEHFSSMDFKFKGSKITVFCERKKETLLKSGVAEEKDIFVVGAPRTDLLFDALNSQDNAYPKNWVVLFTFNYRWYKRYKLWRETLLAFAKAASEISGGEMQFMVKSRDDSDTLEVEQILREKGLLGYVRVRSDISFADIARRGILAIGYNTTAIVEMMATDIPIIVPHWAEAVEDLSNNMLDPDEALAYQVATSPEDLILRIKKILSHPDTQKHSVEFRKRRNKVIEKFIYRIDGKRSQAVAEIIKQSILENLSHT